MTWRWIGTSVVGTSHLSSDLSCQDSHGAIALDNGVLVVAVADGAGSAPRAAEGSRCAVESCITFLRDQLGAWVPASEVQCRDLLNRAILKARLALMQRAGGPDIREFATTLLLT